MNLGIIIPSFNTKDLTTQLVRTLLNIYTGLESVRIIVVENGSDDGSKSQLIELFNKDPKVVIIDNPTNLGFTKAINQGIKKAEQLGKEHFCLLNSDVYIQNATVFDEMCRTLDSHQDFGCLIFDDAVIGQNVHQRLNWITPTIGTVDEGMWYCVMIPKRTIDRIGVLDERFFLHCSDSDYQIRIRQCGLKVGVVKNNGYLKHISFASSRRLPDVGMIIKKDRGQFNIKYNPEIPAEINNMYLTTGVPRIEYIRGSNKPFLTVLTRCYKRPKMLMYCKQSLVAQSDPDYEQILIIDNIGRGRDYANKAFELCKREYVISGQYVMVLDDDDIMVYQDFIKEAKQIIATSDPNAIIFKGQVGDRILPPDNHIRSKTPHSCQIGSFSIMVKKELFDLYLPYFGSDGAIGDFKFIQAVWNHNQEKVYWLDKLICKTQRVSLFSPE